MPRTAPSTHATIVMSRCRNYSQRGRIYFICYKTLEYISIPKLWMNLFFDNRPWNHFLKFEKEQSYLLPQNVGGILFKYYFHRSGASNDIFCVIIDQNPAPVWENWEGNGAVSLQSKGLRLGSAKTEVWDDWSEWAQCQEWVHCCRVHEQAPPCTGKRNEIYAFSLVSCVTEEGNDISAE